MKKGGFFIIMNNYQTLLTTSSPPDSENAPPFSCVSCGSWLNKSFPSQLKKPQIIMNTRLEQRTPNGGIDYGQVGFGDGGVSQEDAAGDHDGDDEVAFPGLEGEQTDFIVHGCNAVDVLLGQVGELNFVCPDGKAYAEDTQENVYRGQGMGQPGESVVEQHNAHAAPHAPGDEE
jgi:hypothetical protein